MSRSERAAGRPFLALLLCAFAFAPAEAHSLAVERGSVEILADRTTLTLEVPITDLVGHDSHASGPQRLETLELYDAARAYEADALRRLAIRETSGARLEGRVETTVLGLPDADAFTLDELHGRSAIYRLVYPTPSPPRYVSFQQETAQPGGGTHRQIVLSVNSTALDHPRTLRLTRGGNVETLSLAWDDGVLAEERLPAFDETCVDHAPHAVAERFSSVQAVVRIDEAGVRLETIVPLPILETWLPVPRQDPDFVRVDEQAAVAAAVQAFFERLDVVRLDGDEVAPVIEAPRFLAPGDPVRTARSDPRTVGAWTGRVAVTRRYPAGETPRTVSIEWQRFNAAVLTAEALVVADGACSDHRFSTYSPRFDWSSATGVARAALLAGEAPVEQPGRAERDDEQ